MATPADQRLLALLDKWLASLELHLKYSSLDADSYSRVQPWPEHQRPSRWILDLARQNAMALRRQVEERIERGDAQFAESLELMTFLANLLGAEHIERFIPLASAETERAAPPMAVDGTAETREMPQIAAPTRAPPVATPQVARSERRAAAEKAPVDIAAQDVRDLVIGDAARLVKWGRKWYELAELISSMADRPSLTDVRRILKDNKTAIDEKAARS